MASADELDGLRAKIVGDRYECPWKKWQRPSVGSLVKWRFQEKDNSNVPGKQDLNKILPVKEIDKDKLNNPPKDKIQVTWIGHATLLVQFDGITILTDPIFSDVCGPVNKGMTEQWGLFGYKRFRPPSCEIDDLPEVDAVIISHSHYDHLDKPSVESLKSRFPQLHWYVGMGLKEWFRKLNCENVHELNWWESLTQPVRGEPQPFSGETQPDCGGKEIKFICTPSQHWCGRTPNDENKHLWCSWVLEGPTKRFFFAGDTGYYQPLFKKIGEKYGSFDLAALPIGAYEPRDIIKYQHSNPEEAVQIHIDVGAAHSVAMHWGTFIMTNEFYLEPPRKVREEMMTAGLAPERFQCLHHGETWIVGDHRDEPSFMSDCSPANLQDKDCGLIGNTKKSQRRNDEQRHEPCDKTDNSSTTMFSFVNGLIGNTKKSQRRNDEQRHEPCDKTDNSSTTMFSFVNGLFRNAKKSQRRNDEQRQEPCDKTDNSSTTMFSFVNGLIGNTKKSQRRNDEQRHEPCDKTDNSSTTMFSFVNGLIGNTKKSQRRNDEQTHEPCDKTDNSLTNLQDKDPGSPYFSFW